MPNACAPYITADNDVLGQEDLNNMLGRFPEIEKKNFKLWLTSQTVLDRVLNNASVVQADFEIQEIYDKIPKYVQNDSFPNCMEILAKNRFAIISGVPGIGKTTLAEMIIYTHVEQGYQPVIVDQHNIEGAFQRYNTHTPIIFYFDDFLGQTFMGDMGDRVNDQHLIRLINLIKKSPNAKLVMTTREYILQTALMSHEKLDHSRLFNVKYVMELSKYTKSIRGKILYNHLYFSELASEYLQSILNNKTYLKIINHSNYNPRIIEWMTKLEHLQDVSADEYGTFFVRNLDNPEKLWEHAFVRQISFHAQTLLLALLSKNGEEKKEKLKSIFDELYKQECFNKNKDVRHAAFEDALKELEGSFVSILNYGQDIRFQNPSVRDFLQSWLTQNLDLALSIFASAISFEQIDTVWEILQDEESSVISEFLKRHSDELLTAVERVLDQPHVVRKRGYNYHYDEVDTPFSTRVPVVIEMAFICQSAEFYNFIPRLLNNVLQQGFEKGDSVGSWANILEDIDVASYLDDEIEQQFKDHVKCIVVENVHSAYLLEEFESILNIQTFYALSDEDKAKVEQAFDDYEAHDEFSDLDSSSELDDYLRRYKSVNKEFGYTCLENPPEFDEVYSKVCQEEDRYDPNEEDWWRESQNMEKQEDRSIEEMFQVLMDK